ncbi:MAG: CPXCG motif-containing cysteine-rich protein [Lentisphaeria bacterium]
MCQLEPECSFRCPFCMSFNKLILDRTEGSAQSFIVDCEICCSPVKISVQLAAENDDPNLVAEPAT